MIELKNIRKVYKANSRKEAIALDDINLKFSNRGLVFVLGPSGSGKTTLLNLLGGLDTPSSGDILIDGKVLNKKEGALDDYRSNYVGFIFQDYNLIDTMSVKDNLSLVCFSDNKENNNKRINEVLSLVGLNGYLDRYPFELSGGERKRVSIARTLLKDSSFILADEPTGSLNKEMAIEVMECLKKISLNRLVVIVTHNEELAKNYGDRIIRLSSGKVVSDEKEIELKDNYPIKEKEHKPNSLTFSKKLKLALNCLFASQVDTFISFLIVFVSLITLIVIFSISNYSRGWIDGKNLAVLDDVHYIRIFESEDGVDGKGGIRKPKLEKILEKFPELEYINNNIIDSSLDAIKMGFKFVTSYQELDERSVYLYKEVIDYLIKTKSIYKDFELKTQILTSDNSNYEELVGTYWVECGEPIKINGIFDVDFKSNADDTCITTEAYYLCTKDSVIKRPNASKLNRPIEFNFNHYSHRLSGMIFANDVKIDLNKYSTISIRNEKLFHNHEYNGITTDNHVFMTKDEIKQINEDVNSPLYSRFLANYNEVYLSLKMYNIIFKENHDYAYYFKDIGVDPITQTPEYAILNTPSHLNEKITLEISDNDLKGVKIKEDFIVKGIFADASALESGKTMFDNFYFNSAFCSKLEDFSEYRNIIIKKDSIKDYKKFSNLCSKIGHCLQYTSSRVPYNEKTMKNDESIGFYETSLFLFFRLRSIRILTVLLALIVFFYIFGFVNRIINRKQKEIGILKASGILNKDILLTYYLLVVSVSIFMVLLATPISMQIVKAINFALIKKIRPEIIFIYYKWWYLLLSFVFIIFVNLFSAFLKLNKIKKMKVADLIRKKK